VSAAKSCGASRRNRGSLSLCKVSLGVRGDIFFSTALRAARLLRDTNEGSPINNMHMHIIKRKFNHVAGKFAENGGWDAFG
jgi:hypothetical protein